MTENEIFTALRRVLLDQLRDHFSLQIKRSYQSTQQGADLQPSIYLHLISQRRYGYLARKDVLDGDIMRHIECQYCETLIQLTGQVLEKADTAITSVDLLNEAASVLQSDQGRIYLKNHKISILRISDVRHVYSTDEQERFQSTPSFDLTIITQQCKETTSPITTSIELRQYKV